MNKIESAALREFSSRLKDRFPAEVDAVKLFGSKARGAALRHRRSSRGSAQGAAGKESDIDVLVLVRERTDEIDEAVIDLVCDILNLRGVYIETVTMTSSNYRTAVKRQYPFALNVEKDAVLI